MFTGNITVHQTGFIVGINSLRTREKISIHFPLCISYIELFVQIYSLYIRTLSTPVNNYYLYVQDIRMLTCACTCFCMNRIYHIATGKKRQSYKAGGSEEGTLIKV